MSARLFASFTLMLNGTRLSVFKRHLHLGLYKSVRVKATAIFSHRYKIKKKHWSLSNLHETYCVFDICNAIIVSVIILLQNTDY